MRFEPKIIRPSEPPEPLSLEFGAADRLTDDQFESRLPGELEFLAAQLRDDAAHLASVYAACDAVGNALCGVPVVAETTARPSRGRTLLAWSAAGTLASVVLAAAVALPWLLPTSENHPPNLANTKLPAENREPDLGRLVQAVVDKSDVRDLAYPANTPAMFLQNVSGPELEGLFDLWEEYPVEQSRISI